MSVHTFALSDNSRLTDIVVACHNAGRAPVAVGWDGTTLSLTFTPDLTAGEVAALAEIVRAGESILMRAERNAIENDIAGLRTYQGIASPTLAQTISAVKAQSRILRALLRDG